MFLLAALASATLCVAVPSDTKPIYYDKGVHIEDPVWMRACDVTPPGWQNMDKAPRDGTIIEIRNAFGLLPTYSINKWTVITSGGVYADFAWVDAKPQPPCPKGSSWSKEIKDKDGNVIGWSGGSSCFGPSAFMKDADPGLAWRPFTGDPAKYVAPNPTTAQWRKAMTKH